MNSARYEVVRVTPGAVFLVDVGEDCRSVTNDAERVVSEIAAQYGAVRIFYRDSSGDWDELQHVEGRFSGFAACPDRKAQYGGVL